MKIKLLFISAFACLLICSCGSNETKETSESTNVEENADTTITGTITKMWWETYQGASSGGINIDDGKGLPISSDYLGDNNSGRIFINKEASDILFLDKEKDIERLNTKYLNKKAKVTCDAKTLKIKSIELLSGDAINSEDTITIKASIQGMDRDKNTGLRILSFINENGGKEEKMRFYLDNDRNYSVTSLYRGKGNKSDFVFCTENYDLSLTPNNINRKAIIKAGSRIVSERNTTGGNKVTLSKQNVILDVMWE